VTPLLDGPSSFSFPLSLSLAVASSFPFFVVETALEEDEEVDEVDEVAGAGLDGRAEVATA
jgi:hypothetical protein